MGSSANLIFVEIQPGWSFKNIGIASTIESGSPIPRLYICNADGEWLFVDELIPSANGSFSQPILLDGLILSESVEKDTNWFGEREYLFSTPGKVDGVAGYFEVSITLSIYYLGYVKGNQPSYHISGPIFISYWDKMLRSGLSFLLVILALAVLYGLFSFGLSLHS